MSDFVLQTTSPSLSHRMWRYHAKAGDGVGFYPTGFAEEAEEVGPCTNREGPCLVLFRRSSLTPAALNAWIAGNTSASCAVVRVFWLGGSPGEASSREDLLAQLLAAGPPPDGGRLRLQCAPRSLEAWLVEQLPPSFDLQPVGPAWVLHVVRYAAGRHSMQGDGGGQLADQDCERFLFSLQPAADLYHHASERGKRVPDQLCKAAGKLAEALEAAGLQLTSGVAIDLGAAPGGWTHVLAQRARRVIAVDPADMDARALAHGAVTHLACKAEDAVQAIHEMVGEAGVDLLVSDMNRHPNHAVDVLRPLLPLLRPGAAVVLTLKFFGRSSGRERDWLQRMQRELGPGFERVQLLWLLANTQHEQTCIAFKAPSAAATTAGDGAPTS